MKKTNKFRISVYLTILVIVMAFIFSGWPGMPEAWAVGVPTVRSVGAVDNGSGAISPGLPSGVVAGDLLIMFVENSGEAEQTASGWTKLDSQSATGTWLTVLYKIAVGSDATTTNDVGNHQIGRIIAITKDTFDAANPFGAGTLVKGTQTSGTAKTIGQMTTTAANALVIAAIAGDLPDSNSTTDWASWTNGNLSNLTEQIDDAKNSGNGGSLGVATGGKASAAATGNTTVTATDAKVSAHMMFAVRPVFLDSDSAVEIHGGGAQSSFNLDPLKDTEGEKFSVLKFQISDTATTDSLPTLIDRLTVNITGTGGNASTDIAWAELYDDTGGARVATSTSISNSTITFGSTPNGGGTAGLDTVASTSTIRYTVNVYMKPSTLTATDGQTYIFGLNDSDVGADTSTTASSQMRSDASAVSNVTGTVTVTTSQLIFSTQPPSTATTNTDFTGTIGVTAADTNNNVDTGFSESITLSAVLSSDNNTSGTGTLSSSDSGGTTKTPTNGVATWTDTKYSYAEAIDIKAVSTSYPSGFFSDAVTVSAPTDTDSAVEVHGGGAQSSFNLNPLNDTSGEKFSVLKFQISDKATADSLPTLIDRLTVDISGTGANASTDIAWAELYDDTGSAQVATSASITNSTITFGSTPNGGGTAALDTVSSGGTIRYTVNIYMKNSALTATDGQTYIFGLNDSDVGTDTSTAASSQMRSDASAVSNVTGTVTVTASQLIFSTQPPSTATIDTDFSGTIGVSAADANNNVDTGFSESITLSAVLSSDNGTSGTGTLSSSDSGGTTKSPTNGVATWTDTKYSYAESIDIKAVSTTYPSGIFSDAVTVSAAPVWTAYNDCGNDQNSIYGSTGNVTNFGAEDAAGELIKYSDGTGTGVTITYSGTSFTEGLGADETHGNPSYPPSGDAAAEFGTIINMGKISYSNFGVTNNMIVTLSGVSSTKTYTLVLLGLRSNNTYVRDSKFVISGVNSGFTNVSSTGTTKSTTTLTDDTTTYSTGDNWNNGYVVKWTNITPTSTSIVVTITAVDLVDDKGYLSAIKLSETGTGVAAATVSSADNQTFTVGQSAPNISTITVTDAATPTITATNDIRIKIPAGFNMTWDTSDTLANIAGTDWAKTGAGSSGGTVTVSFEDSNKTVVIPVTTSFAASDDITAYGLSFANFSAVSSADNLELEVDNAGTTADEDDKTITIVAPTISSAANQSFTAGDSATAISTITVTDAATPTITATNDIRIKIPAGFNMTWDTSDTLANIAGTDWAKTGAGSSGGTVTVSFEDSNKTVVIPVTTSFAASDDITVYGLSFANFSAASSADNLELEVDNAGTTVDEDDKTKTIQAAAAGITLVQQKTNKHTYNSPAYSLTTTLDTGATAGNLLVTGVSIDKNSGTITVPTDFTLIQKGEGVSSTDSSSGAMAYKIAVGGETAIAWSWTVLQEGTAWVGEYSGLASSDVLDVSAENESYLETVTNSISTGTTATTTQADELAIALFASDSGNSVGSSRSWTPNSFTTINELPVPADSGAPFLNVASKTLTSTGTVESTISHSGSDECYAMIATFKTGGGGVATISSAANQSFTVDDSATAISTITVTDAATPTITATNDIRIKIPAGFNMTWDTSDTLANIAGTDWAKTGAGSSGGTVTVSFEDSNKTVVIPVTTSFAASDDITVYGLSFANFSAVSSADNLELEVDNAGTTADEDNRTITITTSGNTVVSAYSSGTPTVPATNVNPETTTQCFGTFSISGDGTVSAITLTEYGTCDADLDLTNVKLFQDDGVGNWESAQDTTQLGSATTFNSSNKATFSGLSLAAGSSTYVHVVADTTSKIIPSTTIGIEILQATDVTSTSTVSATAWPVQLGTSTLNTIYPYLQNVTTSGIEVMWKTDTSSTGSVAYGLTTSYGASGSPATESSAATFHKIVLTGLSANTTYHYQVTCNGLTSPDCTFKTAPAAGSTFNFIAYGDNRANSTSTDFWTTHASVCEAMTTYNPQTIILQMGDYVWDGTANQWQPQCFLPARNVFKNSVLYTALGNHEAGATGIYESYFDPPTTSPGSTKRYYSFNYGNTHFICLDSNQSLVDGSAQRTWVSGDLDSTEATSATWRIAFLHAPAYSYGSHGGDTNVQDLVTDVLAPKGVDVVFGGHNHFYQRCFHAEGTRNGITHITTGGGGALAATETSGTDREAGYSSYHYCLLEVGTERIKITTYDTSNTVQDTAYIPHSATMTSAADQSFYVGDSATAISQITITDNANAATITATNDIRIKIPSTFNMTWDTSDTLANIGGTDWAKTGAGSSGGTVTVSFEDSNKTVVIPVTTSFAVSDDITVYGLSFANFSATSSADNLELVTAGSGGATATIDSKTKTISAILSVILKNAGDTADYTAWTLGSGKELDTAYIMSASECVLVKNSGPTAEDFSISAVGTNWTLGTATALDTCVLMGLFNGDSAPAAGNFSTTYDIINGTTRWATTSTGNGNFEGASDGDNIAASTGVKLYIYLKTPTLLSQGSEESITVTVGCREH